MSISLAKDWHVSDAVNIEKALRQVGFSSVDSSSAAFRLGGKVTSGDLVGVIQKCSTKPSTLINDLASVCKIRSTNRFLQSVKTPVHDVTGEITLAAACSNSIDLPFQTPIFASSAVGLKHLHDVFGDFLMTKDVNETRGNGILCRPEQRSKVVTHAELVEMGLILKPPMTETAFERLARTSMHKTPAIWVRNIVSRSHASGLQISDAELRHLSERFSPGLSAMVKSALDKGLI